MVDQTLYNISKLPSIIVESVTSMMESFGQGIYRIQIFDASTDLVGKPIIICQLFKIGKVPINGDYEDLKLSAPCTIEKFQEWLSTKRAIGLMTLKTKIQDMLKAGKANIIGYI